ncbi:MAG: hypothetical protein M3R41_05060 [Pseudomonadota bacterium]|nr:hypothetical protein [Pseudomonadota bacterium]
MLGSAWKGLGWFTAIVAVALGFLLVPLQVAAERKKLDKTEAQIATAKRDIRALETEFDTRANLAQLEQWNGDTLRLTAPVAAQFVSDPAQLASIDLDRPAGGVQMAALVVPSRPNGLATVQVAAPAVRIVAPALAAAPALEAAVAEIREPADAAMPTIHSAAAIRLKPSSVVLLDRKLLRNVSLGDLMSTRADHGGLR